MGFLKIFQDGKGADSQLLVNLSARYMLIVLVCWFTCRAVCLEVLPGHLWWYIVFVACLLTPVPGGDSLCDALESIDNDTTCKS